MLVWQVIRVESHRSRVVRRFSFDNRDGAEAMWQTWLRLAAVRTGEQTVAMFADSPDGAGGVRRRLVKSTDPRS